MFDTELVYSSLKQIQGAVELYGLKNEAYNVERGRKTPKAVYLQ